MTNNKGKIILILVILFFTTITFKNTTKTKSVDPFFTLVGVGYTPQHMDYLLLIMQHLERIGIKLDIKYADFPWLDGPLELRDYDIQILEIDDEDFTDPYYTEFYTTNGSLNLFGYDILVDWDDELGTGKNEWFIDEGLQLMSNDSQEKIAHCWEWQDYLLDDILPCLPLFTKSGNKITIQLLAFNLRETRPVIGARRLCPSNQNETIGLAVRKAIAYAVNREEIKRVVLGDEFEVIHHPTSPLMSDWLNPNSIKYCFNIPAARGFLTSAGFDIGWYPCVNYPTPKYTHERPWLDWEYYCSNETRSEITLVNSIPVYVITVVVPVIFVIAFVRRKRNLEK